MADIIPLLQQILSRLDVIEHKVGMGDASSSSPSSTAAELPRSIKAFDEYCRANLDPFVAICTKLGGDAATVGGLVKEAWEAKRKLLLQATACKEPPQSALGGLLAGISEKIKAIKATIKRNEWERHTKAVDEGLACLSWVVVKPAPRDFIENFIGASDYYANGIRKEHRTTNPDHIEFCNTFKALLTELMAYVKEFHTTGVAWNPKGVDISEYNPDATPAAAASSPAPAPTPAAAVVPAKPAAAAAPAAPATKVNLFAALNKGGDITSGLKTVTKDMQTWRAEYKADAAGIAPPVAKAPTKPVGRPAEQPKGPAKLEFQEEGAKWIVEYQAASTSGPARIEIKDKRETVYIFGCIGATIDIVGKCKSIVVDSCKKTKVFVDSAMASCEVVNCQRMDIHVREKISAVAIDKTDGIVVHLAATSLDTEIVASKSSEMNVSFPDGTGEFIERPIPEQYVHRIKGLSITADVSDLYGH